MVSLHKTFIQSNSLDPALNLAYEEYLMSQCGEDEVICFLWQSKPCVVIGKHQNPYTECHLSHMKTDGVTLIRRMSGGGAVFQDEGNLNYTFIAPKTWFDINHHFEVIVQGLKSLGIEAKVNERNDITVNHHKISGSAFVHHKTISCHHGTLLVHADIDALWRYLNVKTHEVYGKGIVSYKSNVMNLIEEVPSLTIGHLCHQIKEAFDGAYEGILQSQEMVDHKVLVDQVLKYRSWSWTVGESPKFTIGHKLGPKGKAGILELAIRSGHIEACSLEGPCLDDQTLEALTISLKSRPFIRATFEDLNFEHKLASSVIEGLASLAELCYEPENTEMKS